MTGTTTVDVALIIKCSTCAPKGAYLFTGYDWMRNLKDGRAKVNQALDRRLVSICITKFACIALFTSTV
jgi:hypothetical protein